MAVLTQQQRNTLESAVKQARRVSEAGALNALRAFAVDNPEPFPHMNAEQRGLRNRLRSKARLLGDELPSSGHQQIDQLSYELAYEYWHKILFAKFLEANSLLMHPDGVSVTMEECEELAKEEGFSDKWDIAASFASKMLPAIFRPEDPLMQISFSPDDRIKLEALLEGLDNYIFTADDALGWVYQFWQSEAKDAINKSGDKIDGRKLPAVTQLFTEPYMVHFLIDNTIGAWWVGRNPGMKPPVKFEYLRFLPDGTPAAGKFEGWPDRTAEVTTMDPCMGSGHFVVALFNVLANLRLYEEGLTKEEVTDRVIVENLHGLEIDPRCTQIAAFNLALTAWRFCGRYKELPEMNLACSGIAPKGKKDDWTKLVGKVEREDDKVRMENGMAMLYDHFQMAPELGSLLDPSTIKADLHVASFEQLQPWLKKALGNEKDKDLMERGVIASGIAKAGDLLSRKYNLVTTNVPFLTRNSQDEFLYTWAEKHYPQSKYDIGTMILERSFKWIKVSGSISIVSPQHWHFFKRYQTFRKKTLNDYSYGLIARLGSGAFETITGEVVNVMLFTIFNKKKDDNRFCVINLSTKGDAQEKKELLINEEIDQVVQKDVFKNPECRIFNPVTTESRVEDYGNCWQGIACSDTNRFVRNLWELPTIKNGWVLQQTNIKSTSFYGGADQILFWENGYGEITQVAQKGATFRGMSAWGKKGISIGQFVSLQCTLYLRGKFDGNAHVLTPFDENDLPAFWAFCTSEEFRSEIKKMTKSMAIKNNVINKVPINIEAWRQKANQLFPTGLPLPHTSDSTQWLFHGHISKTNNPLQVALIRLLGYFWPAEYDTEMELSDEARELIREIKKFDHLSDNDGIICIPSVNKEETAANRLRDYLKEVFGEKWSNNTIQQLLEKEESKFSNIESWLRNEFFIQHCKVFHNRPFIWHIWDGRNDGFSALVNYHKLNKENLTKLVYTYLGDWIRMCEAKKKSGESGAEGLLSAAQKLKEKLEWILEGEAPYDIFVRWKPMEQQPIGWDPDMNDGVRLNIRPFMEADVLRKKPNIKWGIDRGKNPPGSPWGEIRDNDRHLTLAEKRAAREKQK
jgi:hypothetical protein